MSDRQLISGAPVPSDGSHAATDPVTGLQKDYVVLSHEERAKGFKKPLRHRYRHLRCGVITTMHSALAETYARDPSFYSGTFCVACKDHFSLDQFVWQPDGEPMEPGMQAAWSADQARDKLNRETLERLELEKLERAEYWRLKAKYFPGDDG